MDEKDKKDIPQQEFSFITPDGADSSDKETSAVSNQEAEALDITTEGSKLSAVSKSVKDEQVGSTKKDSDEEEVLAEEDDFLDDQPVRVSKKPQSRGEIEVEHLRRDNSLLKQLMDSNFMEYASYVICDRAIPKLEDGF